MRSDETRSAGELISNALKRNGYVKNGKEAKCIGTAPARTEEIRDGCAEFSAEIEKP